MANQYGALAAPPALGYGQREEAPIDAVNQWMRSQPWYTSLLRSFGKTPDNVGNLSDYQKQAIIKAAQANGVVVDEGGNGQEIDDSGNFKAKGHGLRNTLIVAGIAAAALATAGAAGAFGGAGAAGGAGASAGGAGAGAGAATTAAAAAPAVAAGAGGSAWLKTLLTAVVPTAGALIGAGLQAKGDSEAAKLQAKGIADALEFEKGAYADITKRLDPWVSSGTSANDRMTQLLGLPARQGTTAVGLPSRGPSVGSYGGSAASGDPLDWADKLSADDRAKVDDLLKKHNSSDNPRYWYGVNAMHGGFEQTGADWNDRRIGIGDGAGRGYSGATAPATAPPSASTPAPTAAPAAEMVQLQAPDGTVRSVPKAQAGHYVGLGAKIIGQAA